MQLGRQWSEGPIRDELGGPPLDFSEVPSVSDFFRAVIDVGDVHVVSLKGELDVATAEGLADWLVEISGSSVVVDLSHLTFMDSSGISAMVVARNRLNAAGDELVLTRPRPIVRRALEVVGLADWVTEWDPTWSPSYPV
jgi:anti-sigma B factor antagonist